MVQDSQAAAASAPATPVSDATANDSSEQSTEDAPLDLTAQQAAVLEAQAQAALEAELAASRRSRGHIDNLQKRLDAAEKKLDTANAGTSTISTDNWNGLLDGLADLLPAGLADRLKVDTGKVVTEARIDALERELEAAKNPKQPETEDEPVEIAKLRSGWERGYVLAAEKAVEMGAHPDDMPTEADWKTVFEADPSSPSKGMEMVVKAVQARSAARARKGERTDAAAGGAGAQATRKGGLTRDMMRQPDYRPSDYTRAERDAALRGG